RTRADVTGRPEHHRHAAIRTDGDGIHLNVRIVGRIDGPRIEQAGRDIEMLPTYAEPGSVHHDHLAGIGMDSPAPARRSDPNRRDLAAVRVDPDDLLRPGIPGPDSPRPAVLGQAGPAPATVYAIEAIERDP